MREVGNRCLGAYSEQFLLIDINVNFPGSSFFSLEKFFFIIIFLHLCASSQCFLLKYRGKRELFCLPFSYNLSSTFSCTFSFSRGKRRNKRCSNKIESKEKTRRTGAFYDLSSCPVCQFTWQNKISIEARSRTYSLRFLLKTFRVLVVEHEAVGITTFIDLPFWFYEKAIDLYL